MDCMEKREKDIANDFRNVFIDGLNYLCENNIERMINISINKAKQCIYQNRKNELDVCFKLIDDKARANDYSYFANEEECR